jgi:HSP20 family protein
MILANDIGAKKKTILENGSNKHFDNNAMGGLHMNNLTRWNPYREMMSLREQMDRLLSDSFQMADPFRTSTEWFSTTRGWQLDLDVREVDNAYLVEVAVPGIDPDDLDITLEQNVLTIKGEVQHEEKQEGEVYHLRERRYGSFHRRITLPDMVDSDNVEANYNKGILTLTLPKTEESKPRRIPVGESHKAIEG